MAPLGCRGAKWPPDDESNGAARTFKKNKPTPKPSFEVGLFLARPTKILVQEVFGVLLYPGASIPAPDPAVAVWKIYLRFATQICPRRRFFPFGVCYSNRCVFSFYTIALISLSSSLF